MDTPGTDQYSAEVYDWVSSKIRPTLRRMLRSEARALEAEQEVHLKLWKYKKHSRTLSDAYFRKVARRTALDLIKADGVAWVGLDYVPEVSDESRGADARIEQMAELAVRLSPRQKRILKWACQGLDVEAIEDKLDYKSSTIYNELHAIIAIALGGLHEAIEADSAPDDDDPEPPSGGSASATRGQALRAELEKKFTKPRQPRKRRGARGCLLTLLSFPAFTEAIERARAGPDIRVTPNHIELFGGTKHGEHDGLHRNREICMPPAGAGDCRVHERGPEGISRRLGATIQVLLQLPAFGEACQRTRRSSAPTAPASKQCSDDNFSSNWKGQGSDLRVERRRHGSPITCDMQSATRVRMHPRIAADGRPTGKTPKATDCENTCDSEAIRTKSTKYVYTALSRQESERPTSLFGKRRGRPLRC